MRRCGWAELNALMIAYHDHEWGVPVHDDRRLFEHLTLDAFQAGLSWAIILSKRENFRQAFSNFDPEKIARFTRRDIGRLFATPGIVRNKQKVAAAVTNARAFLRIQETLGSFDAFVWQFVDGRQRHNSWTTMHQIPAKTRESDKMSAALRDRGFAFVGPTICYAFMQAAGMVNDHLVTCFRHGELRALR
jgi:DNA-3-methyladenine glycosylase I